MHLRSALQVRWGFWISGVQLRWYGGEWRGGTTAHIRSILPPRRPLRCWRPQASLSAPLAGP